MKRRALTLCLLLAGTLGTSMGCASARRGEVVGRPVDTSSPPLARGLQVFTKDCHHCHPGGEAGLGPALNNKPVPGFMVRLQVRAGLGAMPSFSHEKLSPAELDDLVAYVLALRR